MIKDSGQAQSVAEGCDHVNYSTTEYGIKIFIEKGKNMIVAVIMGIGISVGVSVILSEIRLRKQTDRMWKRINDNTMRLNRLQVSNNWRRYGDDLHPVK